MYCEKMHDMFKNIPVNIIEPESNNKKIRQMLLTGTGGECYTRKLQ